MKNKIKIAFIGCGNMGRAIIESMTNVSSVAAFKSRGAVLDIYASDCDEAKLVRVKNICKTFKSSAEAVACADYVFLAVKPDDFEKAVSGLDLHNKTVISVMAGVTVARLRAVTGARGIVRVMPNICARVGESFNAFTVDGTADAQADDIMMILGSFGMCRAVRECDMSAVTGITGSGPAFVAMTLQAFYEEAIACGFSYERAREMAIQTLIGSALAAEKSGEDFERMADAACSKGGTTAVGAEYLKSQNYISILRGAIGKSVARAKELEK